MNVLWNKICLYSLNNIKKLDFFYVLRSFYYTEIRKDLTYLKVKFNLRLDMPMDSKWSDYFSKNEFDRILLYNLARFNWNISPK